MNQDIRLIALDLDGTALNGAKELTERTRRAVIQAAGEGIRVVVATGRTYSSLAPQVLAMKEITCAITSNGAAVNRIPDGEVLYHDYLSSEVAEEMAGIIEREKIDTEVCTGGKAYIGREYYERILSGQTSRDIAYVKDTRHPVKDICEFIRLHKTEIENMNLNFKSLEDKQYWQRTLQEHPYLTPTSSYLYNVELGGENTSKAHALKHLLDAWGLSREQLMAFGDSENDLEMIRMAGVGVAMANAVEELRREADVVTDDNQHDGVAKMIEKLLERRN